MVIVKSCELYFCESEIWIVGFISWMSTRHRTRGWWGEERDVQIPLFDLRAVMFGSFRLELDNHCLSSRNGKEFDQLTRQKFHWWPPNTSLMLRMPKCFLSGSSCRREQTASGGHRLFVFSNWRYFLRVCYQNSRYKGVFMFNSINPYHCIYQYTG